MKYSFWLGAWKAIVGVFLGALPLAINMLPSEIANLTLGAILLLTHNFLKIKAREAGLIK